MISFGFSRENDLSPVRAIPLGCVSGLLRARSYPQAWVLNIVLKLVLSDSDNSIKH